MVAEGKFVNSSLCSLRPVKVTVRLCFVRSLLCLHSDAKSLSVCPSVQRATARNFLQILDCKPILELSPKYLEVLFWFFRSFYFLRYFFDILGVFEPFLCVCASVRGAGRRNFRPILKRKPPFFVILKYLELLFLFFRFAKKSVTLLSPRG